MSAVKARAWQRKHAPVIGGVPGSRRSSRKRRLRQRGATPAAPPGPRTVIPELWVPPPRRQ